MAFNRRAGIVVAGFVLMSTLASAQNPPPPPPNVASPHATDRSPGDSALLTLSGCLERSKPPVTAADTSAAGPQAPFVLRAAAEQGREPVVYQLFPASDAIKLAEHVGHRIQISAAMRAATNSQPGLSNEGVSPATRAAGMETQPKPTGPVAGTPGPSVAQPLFVNAVKMLSVTCDAGK